MNYFKHYKKLVFRAFRSNRYKGDGNMYERHHVKPNALGGKRLVLLTAKEHFIAHFLLYKHFKKHGDKNQKIKCCEGFHAMTMSSKDNIKRYTSKSFAIARNAKAEAMKGEGNPMFGVKRPDAAERIGYGDDNVANKKEVKEKLKNAWKDKPMIECPHCDVKSKNKGNMTRHHFEYCKKNPLRIENTKLKETYLKISQTLTKTDI